MELVESLRLIRTQIATMIHSEVRNYATPGLSSLLVGGAASGKVRLFKADRDTRDWIIPHSHRFDFACLVLAGTVENILFERTYNTGNSYCPGLLTPKEGGLGGYELKPGCYRDTYLEHPASYAAGDAYAMKAHEIHSIRFSRDCEVLFFEGPETIRTSMILEPWSNGRRVPTFKTSPWMFERESSSGKEGKHE